jgi:NAD(P)-dependent dehydrogenase (short-subunit alcohol dehydrogenase family)
MAANRNVRAVSRVVLITGATDGIGRAVAEHLAAAGHTVLAHGRDPAKLAALPAARTYRADLASLDEVAAMADAILAAEPRLDVLVNNAGIGFTIPGGPGRSLSRDGIELRFAVNYLAGYALTRRLLGRLRASAPARIVFVSSIGQQAIDLDDPMMDRGYSGGRAYCQSKLAQVMVAFDLAEELAGSGVTATALHPGTYVGTKLVVDEGIAPLTAMDEAVAAVARLAVAPEVEGVTGTFFAQQAPAEPDPQARNPRARRRLRELSRQLTGV